MQAPTQSTSSRKNSPTTILIDGRLRHVSSLAGTSSSSSHNVPMELFLESSSLRRKK